jgi:hypothetical protein
MAEKDEGFARRWSRLKQEAREAQPQEEAPTPDLPVPAAAADTPPPDSDEKPAEKPFDPATLPPVESLTKESDYSDFMRPEVPAELRQKALRRLWATDPILSAPDPADMHNIDYNAVPTFPEGVKTLYRIGKGMFDEIEAEAEKAAKAESDKTQGSKRSDCRETDRETPEAHAPDAAAQQEKTTEIKDSGPKKA